MVDSFSKRVSHDLEENLEISIRRDHIPRRRYVDKGSFQKEPLSLLSKGENVGKNCH